METVNIMIVGVGGQGSLLASKMLGHLLVNAGYDVKVSEVHGMSQRGGSVVTYVRFGDKVYSPIIDKGEADFIVSFELLEAARWIEYLKPTGQIVTNTQQMEPMPVIAGLAKYPEDLVDKMRAKGIKVDAMDCLALADQAGSSKAVNMVLMGRLSHYFPNIPAEAWQASLEANVPGNFNLVTLDATTVGELKFYGQGAGSLPTGNAIVQDVLDCVRGTRAPKYDFSRGLAYDPELLRASYVIRASQAPAGSEPYAEGAWLVRDVTAASACALLDEALKTDPAAFMAALA